MIDAFGGFIQRNLIVFVAFILLPLKWIVVRLCKDEEAEALALMSVPEDLCYVALGLVMGDVINNSGAFHKHFAGSAHVSIDILITVIMGLAVALLVHRLAQTSASQFRQWRAADKTRSADRPEQGELIFEPGDLNITMLMLRHLALFSLSYAFQLTLVLIWLHWIAKVVANA